MSLRNLLSMMTSSRFLNSGQVAPGSHHQRWHSVRETFNQACAIHLKTSGEIIGEHHQISNLMSFFNIFHETEAQNKEKKEKQRKERAARKEAGEETETDLTNTRLGADLGGEFPEALQSAQNRTQAAAAALAEKKQEKKKKEEESKVVKFAFILFLKTMKKKILHSGCCTSQTSRTHRWEAGEPDEA